MDESIDKHFTPNDISKALAILAKALGVREDFLGNLLVLEHSDWSFVVKAHALLESAVCQLLSVHLREPRLEVVLAEEIQMESRIVMLKALDVVGEDERKMMRALGNLRNRLVHNVKETDFTFAAHFTDKNRRRNFAETFATTWPDPTPGTNPLVSRADYVIQNPRYAIWFSIVGILTKSVGATLTFLEEEKNRAMFEALKKEMKALSPAEDGA